MRVEYVNNDGGGFADMVEVGHATTVKEFFSDKMGTADPTKYRIKVNGSPAGSCAMVTRSPSPR